MPRESLAAGFTAAAVLVAAAVIIVAAPVRTDRNPLRASARI